MTSSRNVFRNTVSVSPTPVNPSPSTPLTGRSGRHPVTPRLETLKSGGRRDVAGDGREDGEGLARRRGGVGEGRREAVAVASWECPDVGYLIVGRQAVCDDASRMPSHASPPPANTPISYQRTHFTHSF